MFLVTPKVAPFFSFGLIVCIIVTIAMLLPFHTSCQNIFLHVCNMNVRRLYAEVESISWLTAVQPNLVLHFDVNRCWNMGLSRTSSHLEVFTRWPGGDYLLVRSRESFHLCSSERWSCVSWLNSFMCGCLTGCWFQCGGVSAQLFLPPHWVCYCRMPLFLTVQTLLTALMGPKGPIVPLNQLERYLLLQYSHVC